MLASKQQVFVLQASYHMVVPVCAHMFATGSPVVVVVVGVVVLVGSVGKKHAQFGCKVLLIRSVAFSSASALKCPHSTCKHSSLKEVRFCDSKSFWVAILNTTNGDLTFLLQTSRTLS